MFIPLDENKDYSPYLLKKPRQWTKVFGDAFYDKIIKAPYFCRVLGAIN